ncbi:MAG: hypothetical protein QOH35_57, partial [Acidobacteriaceae bacterium]|nr:hypothetical protein [Acidobacteriaceae bacterium]
KQKGTPGLAFEILDPGNLFPTNPPAGERKELPHYDAARTEWSQNNDTG